MGCGTPTDSRVVSLQVGDEFDLTHTMDLAKGRHRFQNPTSLHKALRVHFSFGATPLQARLERKLAQKLKYTQALPHI